MKTIALRFAEIFAPDSGTIQAHESIIREKGYVWYGKLGTTVGADKMKIILSAEEPRILLIQSGKAGRYWAYVDDIRHECPEPGAIPEYYRNDREKFKTWFRVVRFEKAPAKIMSQCIVVSSGAQLGHASHYSMSPYFFIEVPEQKVE